MKFDPVFLLVILAIALTVFLPLFDKDNAASKSFRSRKRRKVLLGRLTVVVLLVATFVTLAWPMSGVSSLVQGLMVSAAVLIPAFALNLFASLRYRSSHLNSADTTKAGSGVWFNPDQSFNTQDATEAVNTPVSMEKHAGAKASKFVHDRVALDSGNNSVIKLSAETDEVADRISGEISSRVNERAFVGIPAAKMATESGTPKPYREAGKHSDSDIEAQLDRVSQSVRSHDLGIQSTSSPAAYEELDISSKSPLPKLNNLSSVNNSVANVESMGQTANTGLVTSLQKDNGRLQKLVFAQHAVIASQRESVQRSRDVARDAIKVMRSAESNQRMAEKMARREQAKRQRIQSEYQKVANILENAMSIISTDREPPTTSSPAKSAETA